MLFAIYLHLLAAGTIRIWSQQAQVVVPLNDSNSCSVSVRRICVAIHAVSTTACLSKAIRCQCIKGS